MENKEIKQQCQASKNTGAYNGIELLSSILSSIPDKDIIDSLNKINDKYKGE